MKKFEGLDLSIQVFLTSALDGDKWVASRPGLFAPGTYVVGGWVDPGQVWRTWRGEKFRFYWDSNCYPFAVQPVAIPSAPF
jgi:hypothetical protein